MKTVGPPDSGKLNVRWDEKGMGNKRSCRIFASTNKPLLDLNHSFTLDFLILSNDKTHLLCLISNIRAFLTEKLKLELHPRKLIIRKLTQGIDFVGYVLFEKHLLMRTRSKQRMRKRLKEAYENYLIGKLNATPMDQRLQSYLSILSYANQYTLIESLKSLLVAVR